MAVTHRHSLRDDGFAPALYQGLKRWTRDINSRLRISDHHHFDDRRHGASVLACLLAGYKPELWPHVLPRFKAALPAGADVCVVTPGLRSEHFADLCKREGWSYLSTATNEVALAQNVCYRLHDKAEIIVKIDEDMFLAPGGVATLVAEYRRIKAEGIVDPGFVAPMIPLNGFCYRRLLELLDLRDDYEIRFGRAQIASSGAAIHEDPEAARWLWEKTSPIEATAERLAAAPIETHFCPIRFNIGAIAFERSFWDLIGRLPVRRRRVMVGVPTYGGDEAHICSQAVVHSRPGVVTTATVAGHFAFALQYRAMQSLLAARPELFRAA